MFSPFFSICQPFLHIPGAVFPPCGECAVRKQDPPSVILDQLDPQCLFGRSGHQADPVNIPFVLT